MPEPGPARSTSRQRGAALVIVLVFAALLSELAGAAMRSGTSGARAAVLFADIMQADELARGTADMVSHYVEAGGPERRRGGAFALRLPAASIVVDYVSESARVDANAAPPGLISALLTAAGAEPAEAAAISTKISRSRAQKPASGIAVPAKPTAQAQEDASAATGTPAVPTPDQENPGQAPAAEAAVPSIQYTDEVVKAWELPPALAKRILPALTVSSRSDKVDPVLAGPLVLAALLGGDPGRIGDYMDRRSHGFASADSALALISSPARLFASFSDVPALRATVRVTVAGRFERRYEVVLEPADRPGQRPKTLFWHPLI